MKQSKSKKLLVLLLAVTMLLGMLPTMAFAAGGSEADAACTMTADCAAALHKEGCPKAVPAAAQPTPAGTPAPAGTPTPSGTPTPAGTPTPSGTPAPSGTPDPSGTSAPTGTPAPTDAPAPTGTPAPSDTPAPTGASAALSPAVQAFLNAVNAIVIPEELNEETGSVLDEQLRAASGAYEALSAEELTREDVQAAAQTMQKAMDALTGGAQTTALLTGETFSIVVHYGYLEGGQFHEIEQKTMTSTCRYSSGHSGYNHTMSASEIYAASGYSGEWRVTRYGYWDAPASTTTVNYNITGSAPYKADQAIWVYGDKPGGGDSGNYLWNFTLHYDANGGQNAPADQTYGTNSKYEKSHTFTLSQAIPTRNGYTFLGWADEKGATAPTRQPGGTCLVSATNISGYDGGSVSKTIYAVWKENAPTPQLAGYSTLNLTKTVSGDLASLPANFSITYSYTRLDTNEVVTGTVPLSGAGASLTGSIQLPIYTGVEDSVSYPVSFTENNAEVAGYALTVDAGTAASPNGNPFTYYISATNQSTYNRSVTNTYKRTSVPADWAGLTVAKTADRAEVEPGGELTYTLTVSNNSGKALTNITVADTLNGFLTFIEAQGTGTYLNGVWTIPSLANGESAALTIKAAVSTKAPDGLVIPNTALITGATAEDGDTLPEGTRPQAGVDVTVSAPSLEPGAEDLAALLDVTVYCVNSSAGHEEMTFPLAAGSYSIGELTVRDGIRDCAVTVYPEAYVAAYNAALSGEPTHVLLDPEETGAPQTVYLQYQNGEWSCLGSGSVSFAVVCEDAEAVPAYLVIYRNGDTSTPYWSGKYGEVMKGEDIDLTQLSVGDYYTKDKAAQSFEFEGWYNDGGWNLYKSGDPSHTLGSSLKANGWTNIICMVWDSYAVNYHIGGQTVRSDLITERTRGDYALYQPEARTGYTFDGWYEKEADIGNAAKKAAAPLSLKKYELYGAYSANPYTIVYHGNGGVLSADPEKDETRSGWLYDQEVTLEGSSTFTRDGYIFQGWAVSREGQAEYTGGQTGVFNFTAEKDGLFHLYAVWTPAPTPVPVYLVIYRNGNTSTPHWSGKYGEVMKGEDIDLTQLRIEDYYTKNKAAKGFEFEGWYNDGGWNLYKSGDPSHTLGSSLKANGWTNIICMVWDSYAVNYHIGGQTVRSDLITERTRGDYALYQPEARTGYTFDGWYEKEADIGNAAKKAATPLFLKKYELYGAYSANPYTIVYHGNGGVLSANPEKDETRSNWLYDQEVTLKNKDTFTRDGWVFQGWAVSPEGQAEYAGSQKGVFNFIAEKDGLFHLYAVWTPALTPVEPEAAAYKVEHYVEQDDGSYALTDTDILTGRLDTLVTGEARSYAYHSLDTAHPSAVPSGKVVLPVVAEEGQEPQLLTLKLYYSFDTVTLRYDPNGGEGSFAPETKKLNAGGTAAFLVSRTLPTREDHLFKGWKASDGKVYQAGETIVLSADELLTAVWEKIPSRIITLHYDANGGRKAPADQSEETTGESVLMEVSTQKPTRSGYYFQGWSTSRKGSVQYRPGQAIVLKEDTTLYAVWALPADSPKTGDSSNLALWAAIAGVCLIGFGAALPAMKKRAYGGKDQ